MYLVKQQWKEGKSIDPSLASFKARLDAWLSGVKDCPWTVGRHHAAVDHMGRPSNSLLAWSNQPNFGSPVIPFRVAAGVEVLPDLEN